MTSRDFFWKRATTSTGDTVWVQSALLDCALKGGTVILDGLEQLQTGSIDFLSALLVDGLVERPSSGSDFKGLQRVSSDFHVISTAVGTAWCSLGTLNLFSVIAIDDALIDLSRVLREHLDDDDLARALERFWRQTLTSSSFRFSVRQMVRIASRIGRFNSDPVLEIRDACLYMFLPGDEKVALDEMLQKSRLFTFEQTQTKSTAKVSETSSDHLRRHGL